MDGYIGVGLALLGLGLFGYMFHLAKPKTTVPYETEIARFIQYMKELDIPQEISIELLQAYMNLEELKQANKKLKKALDDRKRTNKDA